MSNDNVHVFSGGGKGYDDVVLVYNRIEKNNIRSITNGDLMPIEILVETISILAYLLFPV